MHPNIIRTLSTGNMKGSFTITTIGRSIGIFDPGFKELIEDGYVFVMTRTDTDANA